MGSFTKRTACPTAHTLLSYRLGELALEKFQQVQTHLRWCDFCNAEVRLLAHYRDPCDGECTTPQMPINLRLLAEALLRRPMQRRKKSHARR